MILLTGTSRYTLKIHAKEVRLQCGFSDIKLNKLNKMSYESNSQYSQTQTIKLFNSHTILKYLPFRMVLTVNTVTMNSWINVIIIEMYPHLRKTQPLTQKTLQAPESEICLFPWQYYLPLFVVLFKLLLPYLQRGQPTTRPCPSSRKLSKACQAQHALPVVLVTIPSRKHTVHSFPKLLVNSSAHILPLWKSLQVGVAEAKFCIRQHKTTQTAHAQKLIQVFKHTTGVCAGEITI